MGSPLSVIWLASTMLRSKHLPANGRRCFAGLLCAAALLLGVSSASAAPAANAEATLHVRYPYNLSTDAVYARRLEYIKALLPLVLDHSGRTYTLEPVPIQTVTGTRNSRNLLSGYYDVSWLNTNITREQELLPIRIPLFKGIIGWRLLLIHNQDQPRFSAVKALAPLKALRAGAGHDWPDAELLASQGFTLQTSANRDSLINMLAAKRIDYFPRSVIEAYEELDMYRKKHIEVEQSLAVVYPSAYYFFVAPDNQALADALTAGLEAIIASGDFEQLFKRFYHDSIARANLSKRLILPLDNPLLSRETPLERTELWFSPLPAMPSGLH